MARSESGVVSVPLYIVYLILDILHIVWLHFVMAMLQSGRAISENHKKLEPKKLSSRVQSILNYDLHNWKQGRIAEALGMTQSRVSIIMNSPLYKEERNRMWTDLQSKTIEKKASDAASGDPVINLFKSSALDAAMAKIDLAHNASSEFVKNSALSEVLDRAGYKAESKKVITSIEVNEKIASRWDKVLKRAIKIETES